MTGLRAWFGRVILRRTPQPVERPPLTFIAAKEGVYHVDLNARTVTDPDGEVWSPRPGPLPAGAKTFEYDLREVDGPEA